MFLPDFRSFFVQPLGKSFVIVAAERGAHSTFNPNICFLLLLNCKFIVETKINISS